MWINILSLLLVLLPMSISGCNESVIGYIYIENVSTLKVSKTRSEIFHGIEENERVE